MQVLIITLVKVLGRQRLVGRALKPPSRGPTQSEATEVCGEMAKAPVAAWEQLGPCGLPEKANPEYNFHLAALLQTGICPLGCGL